MGSSEVDWMQIRQLFERIATAYSDLGVGGAPIGDPDLYLVIPTDEMFDVHAIGVARPVVGSVIDDWTELLKLLADPGRPATVVDLERLGNVLRALVARLSNESA
jgi:hypothetical protein